MNRLLISVILACGLWMAGCNDDQIPAPQFNEGVQVGSRTLLPTVVPVRKDTATILGAAASAEEVASLVTAGGDAAANVVKIKIDDSTPEGLLKGLVAIIESGSLAQLADIVIPEQQAITRQVVEAINPLTTAFKALETQWKEKFPDAPLPGMPGGMPGASLAVVPRFTDLEMRGDAEAVATVEAPQGGQAEKILLKKIDNAWRMQSSAAQIQGDPAMIKQVLGVFGEFAKSLQDIARRMENNEFSSAADAQTAIQQAGQQAFAPIMSMIAEQMKNQFQGATPLPGGPTSPETLQPAPEENPPPPAEQPAMREPDPVDGTYTGPGMLRNR